MARAKLILGLTSIATVLMAPGLGRAQTCTSDADCAKGLSCQADPIATPAVAICYAGEAGGACAPVDNPPPVPTTSCKSAACLTSADCGPTMVCNSQTTTTCTGTAPVAVRCDPTTTACDAGVVPDPVPVSCTDTVTSRCIYQYELPCNVDADCGDGFTCQPTVYGMCSGSSGTGSSGSGSASAGTGGATGGAPVPMPAEVDAGAAAPVSVDAGMTVTCTTVSSYPGHCQAKPVSCTVDADCQSTWTCALVTIGTATAPAAPSAPDASTVVSVPETGVTVPPPATTTTGTCQPPSSSGTYVDHSSAGQGIDITKNATVDAGATTGSTMPPAPAANGGHTTEQTAATTSGGSGCSLGASGLASEPSWLLGLLGVLGLMLARRRRS